MIHLRPEAVLTGHVRGSGEAPLANVRVTLFQYLNGPLGRRMTAHATAVTNELGEYRIAGLEPEKYYARATPPAACAANGEKGSRYRPVFYSGSDTPGQAGLIELSMGRSHSLDFTLPAEGGATISGTIAAPEGA